MEPLDSKLLYRECPVSLLNFDSTDDLEPIDSSVGQERAISAIRYAIDMPHSGYNLFVAGSPGLGKLELVKDIIARHHHAGDHIADWCYVNNFDTPHQPRLLKLPKGRACKLKTDMAHLIERLLATLPAVFQSDDYRQRMMQLREEYSEREEKLFKELNELATQMQLAVIRTPHGFTIGPVRDGKMLSAKQFRELPEDEQERIKEDTETINKKLQDNLETINSWQEESLDRVREANNEAVHQAIDPALKKLKSNWADVAAVTQYLERVHQDLVDNASDFFTEDNGDNQPFSRQKLQAPQFIRYAINVLVDNSEVEHEPIHYEDNPSYQNLVGRVEHTAEMGALVTNFSLIKPGALHLANGGYLIVNAFKLLTNPFSYEALKRVLSAREIRIESVERMLSLMSTTTLEPEPMPADFKVVLVGDRMLYHLLKAHDPEFSLLFKIQADFSETMPLEEESIPQYARIIAGIARKESLLPFGADAVARTIEHCARMVENTEKITLHRESIADLMREAHYQAQHNGVGRVAAEHVEQAIAQSRYRSSRYQEEMQDIIAKGTLMISTSGEHAAQINGLSVYQLGDHAFGRPSRITATARVGGGKVIDIERESDLGGTLHSKGVMIHSSLLASRYARKRPMALTATLVFEQSYGPIDGDSASVAELLALLSAITRVPLRQNLAITGSINQHGQVQAIGGVNEKIEGFFDICQRLGPENNQGVVIPSANVRHLMLRQDIRDACRQGQFHIYAIDTLDQAIELFTGQPAGERDAQDEFPVGTFNRTVEDSLAQFAQDLKDAKKNGDEKDKDKDGDDD